MWAMVHKNNSFQCISRKIIPWVTIIYLLLIKSKKKLSIALNLHLTFLHLHLFFALNCTWIFAFKFKKELELVYMWNVKLWGFLFVFGEWIIYFKIFIVFKVSLRWETVTTNGSIRGKSLPWPSVGFAGQHLYNLLW